MIHAKIRKIGNSLGLILPREALKALGVEEGDSLFLSEGPDGYRLSPYDPEFGRQMEAAGEGLKAYRNALRELSKR